MESGRQNSMETMNNRLMGTALIDKASPSEARGCVCVGMEDESVKSVNKKYQVYIPP